MAKGNKPFLNRRANAVIWHFSDEEGYAETIHIGGVIIGHLMRSLKTKEVVGVKIFLDGMPLMITDSPNDSDECY